MRRTSTPIVCSRCASASATPPLSGMITTRRPRLERHTGWLADGERRAQVGTGTRRGMRLAASKLARAGRERVGLSKPRRRDAAGFFCAGSGFSCTARRAGSGRIRQARLPVARELDHVGQGREVAQLQILVARNVVRRSHRREHLRLFDGVDAEVGFEIEVQVQHVFRIAGLLGHDLQHFLLNRIVRGRLGRDWGWRGADGSLVSWRGGVAGAPARSGRFSNTNRMTCARVG